MQLQAFVDSCKDEWLTTKLEAAFSELEANYESGDKVTKDKWPKYYKKTWGVNNLYVHKLGPDWRLTYALQYDGVGISVLCIEVLTHKKYDKRFGYRTT